MRVLLWMLLLFLTLSCDKSQRPPAKTSVSTESRSPVAKSSSRPAGRVQESKDDACEHLLVRFRAVLDQSEGKCVTDDDCACYPAVVNCGGVTDLSTAARLDTLARMHSLASCSPKKGCVARKCSPVCVQGRCTASASALRQQP